MISTTCKPVIAARRCPTVSWKNTVPDVPRPPTSSSAPRILGVDPGTRVVGYGLLEVRPAPHGFAYIECGVLRADAQADLMLRVHQLVVSLGEALDEFAPTEVAMETAFHGLNASSALKLAEARGALRQSCVGRGVAVFEYPPARVKRTVVGHGRATKHDVQARVGVLCALQSPPSSDAADALAVAICHAHARLLPPELRSASSGGLT
ncbi:MAG: crossover junction endodeoxyribonuclease RuvC [Myxococcales bacterium FL481]|nr:MAG: crossover junction endodeoxyribonuclease RuvC [Myxococcales bacterium FL481]